MSRRSLGPRIEPTPLGAGGELNPVVAAMTNPSTGRAEMWRSSRFSETSSSTPSLNGVTSGNQTPRTSERVESETTR